MKLPTTRFKVTLKQYALLKPGLDILATRLATAEAARFPFRHPWHGIDFLRSDVHRGQAFDHSMAERILSVPRKPHDLTCTRKVRMDFFEISVAVLALRLYAPTQRGFADIAGGQPLARKLEMNRKRAKRAAENRLGSAVYRVKSDAWRRFVAWCRYNLLHRKSAGASITVKSLNPFQKKYDAQQRTQLALMIGFALK